MFTINFQLSARAFGYFGIKTPRKNPLFGMKFDIFVGVKIDVAHAEN